MGAAAQPIRSPLSRKFEPFRPQELTGTIVPSLDYFAR
jgi:hypothetical protein